MKQIKLILALSLSLFYSVTSFSQGNSISEVLEKNDTLKINFSSKGVKGILYVAIYDNGEDFMRTKKRTLKLDMTDGKNAQLIIDNLVENKEYAITAYLDENGNKKLDKNAFGIPQEPYGFSRNVKGFFGPPSYKDTKFIFKVVENPLSIIVN